MEQLHFSGNMLFQVSCGRPTVRVGNPRCTGAGNGTFCVPLIFMQQDWAGLASNPASFEPWQRGGLMNSEGALTSGHVPTEPDSFTDDGWHGNVPPCLYGGGLVSTPSETLSGVGNGRSFSSGFCENALPESFLPSFVF